MLTREVLDDGRVRIELSDMAGLALLTVILHQPGGETLLHGHLFEWSDDRDALLARFAPSAHQRLAAGDDVRVLPLLPR